MSINSAKKPAALKDYVMIPSYILRDRSVSILEVIVEYLKDQKSMNYHEIGILLNRNERTVWTCYTRAKKKRKR